MSMASYFFVGSTEGSNSAALVSAHVNLHTISSVFKMSGQYTSLYI